MEKHPPTTAYCYRLVQQSETQYCQQQWVSDGSPRQRPQSFYSIGYVHALRDCIEGQPFRSIPALWSWYKELVAMAHPDALHGLQTGFVIAMQERVDNTVGNPYKYVGPLAETTRNAKWDFDRIGALLDEPTPAVAKPSGVTSVTVKIPVSIKTLSSYLWGLHLDKLPELSDAEFVNVYKYTAAANSMFRQMVLPTDYHKKKWILPQIGNETCLDAVRAEYQRRGLPFSLFIDYTPKQQAENEQRRLRNQASDSTQKERAKAKLKLLALKLQLNL